MQRIREFGFSEWAYDDRIYNDPWVQDPQSLPAFSA
jgi:hypothetical protein